VDERVADAALLYLLRQQRILDPSGYFDRAGRWYADENEELPCCKRHYPSRRRPYRMTVHCRTLGHVVDLLGVDYAAADRLLRTREWCVIRKLLRLGGLRTGLKRDARPTVRELAPILLQKAKERACELTDAELNTFVKWVRAYCPEVDDINWDAIRAYQVLQQQ
jgi:hypothetical protein